MHLNPDAYKSRGGHSSQYIQEFTASQDIINICTIKQNGQSCHIDIEVVSIDSRQLMHQVIFKKAFHLKIC